MSIYNEDVDFKSIQDNFVLKYNHNSGYEVTVQFPHFDV